MKNPTMAKIRRAGHTIVRWYSRGTHQQNQIGWITEERTVGKGKRERVECRVQFVSDRTRWVDKNDLTLLTKERAKAITAARDERHEQERQARREQEL